MQCKEKLVFPFTAIKYRLMNWDDYLFKWGQQRGQVSICFLSSEKRVVLRIVKIKLKERTHIHHKGNAGN